MARFELAHPGPKIWMGGDFGRRVSTRVREKLRLSARLIERKDFARTAFVRPVSWGIALSGRFAAKSAEIRDRTCCHGGEGGGDGAVIYHDTAGDQITADGPRGIEKSDARKVELDSGKKSFIATNALFI